MVARRKHMTGKPLEENKTSEILLKEADQQQDSQLEIEAEGTQAIVDSGGRADARFPLWKI